MFLASLALSTSITGLSILGSFDANADTRVGICAFFGAGGIGFALATLVIKYFGALKPKSPWG